MLILEKHWDSELQTGAGRGEDSGSGHLQHLGDQGRDFTYEGSIEVSMRIPPC